MKNLITIFIVSFLISCSSDSADSVSVPEPTPISKPVTPAAVVKYTLSVTAGEGGTVSTTGGEYESGQTVSVTATPEGEYLFKDWSDGNTNATRTITVSSNSTLTANFEKKKYPLTVNIEGEGEVLEEIVNAGRTTDYDSGTTVKLTAVPSEGWEFVGWTGAIESAELEIQILVSEAKTISATFSLITNASDYNPVTQTVFLKFFDLIAEDEYGDFIFSESPTVITVPVISVEGSRHKIYNPEPDSYKIIELDIENNVVYLDDGRYYAETHATLPVFKTQVITPSGLSTSIILNYFESFTNGQPLYEYITDYSKHIQGKELIAVKQKIIGFGDEPVWTPFSNDNSKKNPFRRSGKFRIPFYGDGLSDLAYSKMDSMVYNIELDTDIFKNIKIKYIDNVYENEDEIISELNPYSGDGGDGGFDEMVKGMKGTDAAKYLEEIYLLGGEGREYFAAATAGNGVIKFLYPGEKPRDIFTHEMGHVWQVGSLIGKRRMELKEWEELYNSGVFVSDYGMVNPQEFFAEAFMIYWDPNFNNPNITDPETGEIQYTLPASVEAKLDSYFKN